MSRYKPSRYDKTFTAFSGADIIAVVTPRDGGKPRVLGELQTISYSLYRPTAPVFGLGRVGAKGVVKGARTIAGTLIFTVFDRHAFYETMKEIKNNKGLGKRMLKADEVPPFDITINFLNEYGESAQMVIYGVHLMAEGQTMSIEDIYTENTMEYIAMDIDSMTPDVV